MKDKKIYFLVLGLLGVLGIVLTITLSNYKDFRKLTTDSGFDSSWDSGGGSSSWDSGSSWDSSSSSHSYSGSGGSAIGALFGMAIFVFFIILICVLISSGSKNNPDSTNLNQTFKPTLSNLSDEDIKLLNMYGYTNESVLDAAYKAYVNIQYAWSNLDIDKAKDKLSDELYNTYKSQINVLKAKKQKNVMRDFKYIGGGITSIKETGDTLTISLELSVDCKDYLVNSTNNQIVRGIASKTNHYTYSLTFVVTKGENANVKNCPNCSAELGEGSSVKCEYCGSTITRKTSTLTLTRKEMLRQS